MHKAADACVLGFTGGVGMNCKSLSNTKYKRVALAYCMLTQHILLKRVRDVSVSEFDESTGLDVPAVESSSSAITMQRSTL